MSKFPKKPTLLIRANEDIELFDGIIAECDALGWRVINLLYAENYVAAHQKPIGAVIAHPPQDSSISSLREIGIPIVQIWSPMVDPFDHDASISEDLPAAGRLAADVFVERGFKDLAFIAFRDNALDSGLFSGYKEHAEVHGARLHVCQIDITTGTQTERYHAQLETISKWIKDHPKPLAILSHNYRMAVRTIAACELAGCSVPEDVAVAIRGNREQLCKTAQVPLSAIDMNRFELGKQAVKAVKRLVDGERLPKKTIQIPIKGFVERRSTDILAVTDPRVAKAVRFIWDHLNWPIKVEDVAYEVGTSRNTIERAFRQCLHRGVNAELRRKRLESCGTLLRSTSKTIEEIAKETGFPNPRHLRRSFKAAYGVSPRDYRVTHRQPFGE